MSRSVVRRLVPLIAMLLALPLYVSKASALETGDLQLKEGYVDPVSGLRVEKIEVSEDQSQKVTVSLPHPSGTIEEVVVTAPKEEAPIKQKQRFEVLNDYQNNRYGLVIYLNERRNVPLRLYFNNDNIDNPNATP